MEHAASTASASVGPVEARWLGKNIRDSVPGLIQRSDVLRPAASALLISVAALGCRVEGPHAVRPTASAQSASPSADVVAVESPGASMSGLPSASAAAAPKSAPPLPPCEPVAAHPVEPFEFDGSVTFLASGSAPARSLASGVQAFVKGQGKSVETECVPTHVDGTFVHLICSATWLGPSPRFYGMESLSFVRDANGWRRANFADLLPVEGVNELVDGLCRDTFRDGITSLGVERPDKDDAWLAIVSPTTTETFFAVGGIGSAAQSIGCSVEMDPIAPFFGCGPLAHIRRPELLDGAKLAAGPTGPLAVTSGNEGLRVSSVDARQRDVVLAVQSEIDAWVRRAKETHAEARCRVTLDTSEILSARCEASMGDADPDEAQRVVEGLAFRLSDGARIPVEALFAKKGPALTETAASCVKPHLPPADPSIDPGATSLAVSAFKGFTLTSTAVYFEVPMFLRYGTAAPRRTFRTCSTTLAKLGTSLVDLTSFKP